MSNLVQLGKTQLQVSPICFGTWQLSPRLWGDLPEETVISAVRRAFDLGVNFYDTADAYGDGNAEFILGKALVDLPRDQVVVATKVYHHFFTDGRRYGDLSRGHILEACDASLRRLKIETIDLYQCHTYDHLTPPAEIAEAMEHLLEQGKIRAYGTSNWGVEQLRLGGRYGHFRTSQSHYNLLRRDIERDLLPYCQANDIGVLVYGPLAQGLLSGKYRGGETFDDLRRGKAMFRGEPFRVVCDRVRQCAELASAYDLSVVQLILVATLMHPGVECAIVGIKRPEQIEDAAGAMGRTISREDWYTLRTLVYA